MIKQLTNIYPSLIIYKQNEIDPLEDYQWFISKNKEIIGIKHDELSAKDIQILSAFLKTYNINLPKRTASEDIWYERIHSEPSELLDLTFRFVYFTIEQQNADLNLFKETINALFGKDVAIIFEDETSGIIIEELSVTDELVDYNQIIEVMMSDLFIKVKFFIGEFKKTTLSLQAYYTALLKTGKLIFKNPNVDVIHYIESIPHIILDNLNTLQKESLVTAILKGFRHDDEMLKTIQLFLNHNQNVSETAKQMYMHRNSLQYRIDKFINETGINIQNFNEALTVQLGLLIRNSLD